jgi:diaminopimelate decarboxylase
MHHFDYRNGVLHAEDVDLVTLADKVGTPFYCYSTATLERHYRVFAEAFAGVPTLVCYSLKANSNQGVIATLARAGAGADIVSGGELLRALAAGVPADKIVFSGLGKTKDEMGAALKAEILSFNVESESELAALSEIASAMGRVAPISVRVNPDVDAKTHKKIATGKSENKFGVPLSRAREVYALAAKLPGIRVAGVDMHIGSQITDLAPFDNAAALLAEVARDLMREGHRLEHIDLGGGLGIPYRPDDDPPPLPSAYAETITRHTRGLGLKLIFEIGRLIVGNAGILLTRVLYVKRGEAKTFIVIDAAMNDLIRPTLYDAYHDIRPARDHDGRRLWRGAGLDLQHPAARPRGDRARQGICSGSPAPGCRSDPCPRPPAPLAVPLTGTRPAQALFTCAPCKALLRMVECRIRRKCLVRECKH